MSLYGLETGFKSARKKIAVVSGSITGTGGIATGLGTVDSAIACGQNSATTIPSNEVGGVTSISAGTVNVVVIAAAAAANTVSAVAETVAVWAIGNF